jgi:hypothetical protein
MNRLCWFALLIVLSIIGCAKKAETVTGPSDTGANPVGTPISVPRRLQILDTVAGLDNSLAGQDPTLSKQKLLGLLRAQPEVLKADISPAGVLWAVFTDKQVFALTPSFDNTTLVPYASQASRSRVPAPLRKGADNLPLTKKATVLNALGSAFDNPKTGYYGAEQTRKDVAAMLTNAGYSVRSGNDASIQGLKNVNGDDAVFHMTTHGLAVPIVYDGTDTIHIYGLWTNEVVTPLKDSLYKSMLDNDELVRFRAKNIYGFIFDSKETHYAITDKFVRNYMHLGKNSLVYITACSGSSADAAPMIEAFGTIGASVYAGWTQPTSAQGSFYAARFFFDRALGMNSVNPIPNPPQRPFEYFIVYEDMQFRKMDVTTTSVDGVTSTARLTFRQLQDDFIQLLPSISLSGQTGQTKFSINGVFGDLPGVVKLNGSVFPTDSPWRNTVLAMNRPQTGGLLWIEVNGLASNKVPLTEWDGTITYTNTGSGTLKQTVTINVILIADVHRYRIVSGANVVWSDIDFWGAVRGAYLSAKSSGTFEASGEYRDPTTHELLESWTGGGSLQLGSSTASGGGFTVDATVDSVGGNAFLLLSMSAPYNRFTKAGGNQQAAISLGGLGVLNLKVQPGFVLPSHADSIGTAKLVWSGSTPDPKYVQQKSDQR